MLNPRLLVMLCALPDADAALDMALSALAHAHRPFGLRFAMPEAFREAMAAALPPGGPLGEADLRFYGEAAGLAALLPLASDETHVLRLAGRWAFADLWDQVLYARFAKRGTRRAVMTATVEGEADDAQACLPALTNAEEGAATLGAGLPLVCSRAPVKTLLIDPRFLFAEMPFLAQAHGEPGTLSIAAFAAGYAVYALDHAPLWPQAQGLPAAALLRPGPELLPPPALARFEQLAGFSFQRKTVTERTRMGLFNVENGYPQDMPPRVRARELWLALLRTLRRTPQPNPLAVTAFIDLPDAPKPQQAYLQRFTHLMALEHLPLVLYAGGALERQLRARFANTLAYPDNALLPRAYLSEGMTPAQRMRRGKLLLLRRAQHAYPACTHLMWLDFDLPPHPLCPDAPLHCQHLLDERAHLAWVEGEPDASMLVVPALMAGLLAREAEAITQIDVAEQRPLGEAELLHRLVERFPDLFVIHPMPARALLFFTCVDPALLSAPLRKALAGLPKPIRMPPLAPPKERDALA